LDESVRNYIDAIPGEQRPLFDRLHSLILDLYPDAEVVISYQVPTYKAAGGRVSLGLWKDGVSLYTTGPEYIETFKARHPKIRTGKASLNFRLTDDLPEEGVREVVRQAIEQAPGSSTSS
jgi:uncharacterized protein YdhG (YjbR/CyaY superfamily)